MIELTIGQVIFWAAFTGVVCFVYGYFLARATYKCRYFGNCTGQG